MMIYKQKRNQNSKGNRILISITVIGSAGPIRFVVNEDELVSDVMDTTLKSYAREGRLPILGSDLNGFLLYCPNSGSDAMNPWDTIGSQGTRNFLLCKNPQLENVSISTRRSNAEIVPKKSRSFKSWINKSLNLKISSH